MVRRPESAGLREFRRLFQGGSLAGLNEAELLERFAAEGDEAAFEAIVRRLGPMVLGVCRRMLGDRPEAEDAFQATFLVLARRAGAIRDGSRLGPWLFGVAHRVARRVRSQDLRRKARERSDVDDLPGPAFGSTSEKAEVLEALDDEIARLPEAQRRPIVLCYLSGLTIDQAADRLGIPVGTARSRLARGRDRLRARLEGRGFQGQSALLSPMLAAWTGRPSPSFPLVKEAVAMAVGGGATGKVATVGLASAPAFLLAQGALRTMTIWKISTLAAGLVPALVVGGSIGLAGVYVPEPGLGAGLVAPATAVASLDDDDAPRARARQRDAETPKEERHEIRIELQSSADGPGSARIVRAEGVDSTEHIKAAIEELEAELARLKARLAEAEGEGAGRPADVDEARAERSRAVAGELAEVARRRAEEVAVVARVRGEELAEDARRQAESALEDAQRRVEEVTVRAAEAATRAVEAAGRAAGGRIELKIEDDIARIEGDVAEEIEIETDVIVGRPDGGRDRTIVLRRPADAPAPPAPPAPPGPPPAVSAPPAPPTPAAVVVRPVGGDLDRRLSRIEERLNRLDSLEQKIDRLVEALGDRP